jgi:hypothetical protein
MKSILTPLFLLLFTISIQAQFSGDYAPANWSTAHSNGCDDGSIDASGAPASILLHSSNVGGCGGSYVAYSTTVQGNGTISFDWDFVSNDVNGSSFDPFGYFLNGNPVQLSVSCCFNCCYADNGSASIAVACGDVFAFYVASTDNILGRSHTTVSNFSAPGAPVCDLTASILGSTTVYVGYGPLSCTTLTADVSTSNGPVTISWTEDGVAGDGVVCGTNAGCIDVELTVTDAECCEVTTSETIEVIDAICYTPSGKQKVEICHNGHTICVDAHAVPAHLAHGDPLGSCGETSGCEFEDMQVATDVEDPMESTPQSKIQARTSGFTPSVEQVLALSNHEAEHKSIAINPNPAKDEVFITVNRGTEGPAQITVFNVAGQEMLKSKADITLGVPVGLNIRKLNEGQYTILLESNDGTKLTERLTIGNK